MDLILKSMCSLDETNGCLLWQGTGQKKVPYFTIKASNGSHIFPVVQTLIYEKYKVEIPLRACIVPCSHHVGCVNLDHVRICRTCAQKGNYYDETLKEIMRDKYSCLERVVIGFE